MKSQIQKLRKFVSIDRLVNCIIKACRSLQYQSISFISITRVKECVFLHKSSMHCYLFIMPWAELCPDLTLTTILGKNSIYISYLFIRGRPDAPGVRRGLL